MRALLLLASVALALGGCGKSGQADNNQVNGDNLTAASIVSNDVTAIDAVTGDAANMAADVDMNFGGLEANGAAALSNQGSAKPSRSTTSKPATTPEANSTANAATNAE